MEKHNDSIQKTGFEPDECDDLKGYFQKAFSFTMTNYRSTVDEISSKDIAHTDKTTFFREYIWVVHATGFSAKAVSKFLDRLFTAYGKYDVLSAEDPQESVERVRKIVNNPQKILAVHKCASLLTSPDYDDWESKKSKWKKDVSELANLPYIGTTTMYHLGRNIGLKGLVKPDLHLVRMASRFNQESPIKLCEWLKGHVEEAKSLDLGIIDLCLWYYASTFGTINMKEEGMR
jgi:thermostable 8-oxoguanine DNA glycosylase